VSEFYKLTFHNTLSISFSQAAKCEEFAHLPAYEDGTDSLPKRRHIKFRHREINHKKAYNKLYVYLENF